MPEVQAKSTIRTRFFELLFQDYDGWVCIATTHPDVPKASFHQEFFKWPEDYTKMELHILNVESKFNVYFCPNLLTKPDRKRESSPFAPTDILWADLDTTNPEHVKIPPSVVVVTSPERYQAFWRLSTKLPAVLAEDYSKRIAYAFNADKSGWDLGQLLRVPLTYNRKYGTAPLIQIERALEAVAVPLLFEALPLPPEAIADSSFEPMPPVSSLPDPEHVIYKYQVALSRTAFTPTWAYEPVDDWSKILWKLLHICFDVGMSREEVFSVARTAKCNKYARDGRPVEHLWRDVLKAGEAASNITIIAGQFAPLNMPHLVDEPPDQETFIDKYRIWAEESTDAVSTFHDLSAFMLLSAVVSNSLVLRASYGEVVPNLWGLILGDSTLARKTTAMRMIMEILNTIDPDLLLATDGSAEGLFTGLSSRPNRVSIFFRDEVAGFFEGINRKDYLAAIPEMFAELYDVPQRARRVLRKETIYLERPIFIFFGGGVRDAVYESINEKYVLSGFLPRFLVVSGDTDFGRLRRTGPATDIGLAKRSAIVDQVADLYEHYAQPTMMKIGGQAVAMPPRITVNLTDDAWTRYGEIEEKLVSVANDSLIRNLALPTFERLSRSLLKMATILGASRQQPTAERAITVEVTDVDTAAWYAQDWGRHSIELITNAGMKPAEKLLIKIHGIIDNNPGILRSTITKHYHLTKREADEVLNTLEDRMMVRKEPRGRGASYYAV